MEINIFGDYQIFCRKNPAIPDRTKVFTYDQIMGNALAYKELIDTAKQRGVYNVLVYIPEKDIVVPTGISRITGENVLMDVNDYFWRHEKPGTYAELRDYYLIVGRPSLKQDL